jgi:hypothetical protein
MASYANVQEANRKTRDEFDTARSITDGFRRASVTMNTMIHIKQGSVGFPEGNSGQVVIKFTTVNDYPCHLTFHTGRTDAEGAAGAFHVVIHEKGSEPKRYYRFKPSIDESLHLKLDNIEYIPTSEVFGLKRPLGDVHLDGAMQEVIQAVNTANIYAGKPTAHVQQSVKSIMNQRHIDKIKTDYTKAIKDVKSISTFNKLWATDKKQDLIDYYNANKTNTKEVLNTKLNTKVKEMLEAAAAAEPAKKGGKRKQTRKLKRRKMNKRKTRRHRS